MRILNDNNHEFRCISECGRYEFGWKWRKGKSGVSSCHAFSLGVKQEIPIPEKIEWKLICDDTCTIYLSLCERFIKGEEYNFNGGQKIRYFIDTYTGEKQGGIDSLNETPQKKRWF